MAVTTISDPPMEEGHMRCPLGIEVFLKSRLEGDYEALRGIGRTLGSPP